MDKSKKDTLRGAWIEAIKDPRRDSSIVTVGAIPIGGEAPVAVQTMTDCDTNDIEGCLNQIGRIRKKGCRIIRMTTQGLREAESFRAIAEKVHTIYPGTALVADVHFLPYVAEAAAEYADKVRINPGNYNDRGGSFAALIEKCRQRGVALRIGVNHGSLSDEMVNLYGDTPEGMAESAMKFLRICRDAGFDQVVISMKSSNTRVMVQAYRLLTAMMYNEGMRYPLHLGVTEAGNGMEGRIKSATGIGALMADGLGDTIRVSLTEAPENEIPVAASLAEYCMSRIRDTSVANDFFNFSDPFVYSRRPTHKIGRIGGGQPPLLYRELDTEELRAVQAGEIAIVSASGSDPVAEWRKTISVMEKKGDMRPVILHRIYSESDPTLFAIQAAADFGVMFIDGVADGIYIENPLGTGQQFIDATALDILQASRARMSKTEFIACPGCGRTLYALQETLARVKGRLSHLKGLKIGVMGCIVNGPGEMADADYGYVGASPGHISLYRGKEQVRRNIPQEEALDALIELIKSDGRWTEPQ